MIFRVKIEVLLNVLLEKILINFSSVLLLLFFICVCSMVGLVLGRMMKDFKWKIYKRFKVKRM